MRLLTCPSGLCPVDPGSDPGSDLPARRRPGADTDGGDGERPSDCGRNGRRHALEHDGEAACGLQRQGPLQNRQCLISDLTRGGGGSV